MADQVTLAARARAGSGKGEARALRREGRVPAVTYGADLDEARAISVDALDLYHALHTDAGLNAIINLEVDGEQQLVIARELQRHPVKRHLVHADFVTISRTVKIHVEVRIVTEGTAPGEDEGGVAEQQLYTIPVEVLPLEVPDQLVLDISDMQVGDVKRVQDLALPEGVVSLEDPERTIVTVNVPSLEVPEPEEGAPLEPIEGVEAAVDEAADSSEESDDDGVGGEG
ncbi:MAG TPA: 50S ribosomal protein L25 [Egibacteraceae bacterium]|nr:50S ribosomal protein L25 [Egibacteraceae bacterium]